MKLIVGLGNPGEEYSQTRHNAGFMVIGHWARSLGVRLGGRRFYSRSIQTQYQGKDIILLRPGTYMNRSGKAVKACADFHGIVPEDILIVHDDIDLGIGRIKAAWDRGAGGHKGVLSLIYSLGTRAFCRIKIGVGRPGPGEAVEDYVLSPFPEEEKDILKTVLQRAVGGCELFVSEGIESAMNKINRQNSAKGD